MRPLGDKFRAPARSLLCVLPRVPQGGEVRPYGSYACRDEQRRAACEVAAAFRAQGDDALADPQRGHRYDEIICYLRVVGSYLERCEQSRECSAGPCVAAQRAVDAGHHERGVDQRPHLGYVSGADDEHEVCGESVCECRDEPHPWREAEQQHRDPHGRHREEEERGGCVDHLDYFADGALDGLSGIFDVDEECWHAAEHASRPLCVLARGGAVVEDILAHALILLHVVLHERLAAELRREVERRDEKEEHDGGGAACGPFV